MVPYKSCLVMLNGCLFPKDVNNVLTHSLIRASSRFKVGKRVSPPAPPKKKLVALSFQEKLSCGTNIPNNLGKNEYILYHRPCFDEKCSMSLICFIVAECFSFLKRLSTCCNRISFDGLTSSSSTKQPHLCLLFYNPT